MAGGPAVAPAGLDDALAYPFFQAVFDRKSRRVGLGMSVGSDVLAYASPYEPVPLSELEEALLCTAGTGLTGLNLADLDPATGMSTLVQWTTRTWPSSCSSLCPESGQSVATTSGVDPPISETSFCAYFRPSS